MLLELVGVLAGEEWTARDIIATKLSLLIIIWENPGRREGILFELNLFTAENAKIAEVIIYPTSI
jgi:hypothetical protein